MNLKLINMYSYTKYVYFFDKIINGLNVRIINQYNINDIKNWLIISYIRENNLKIILIYAHYDIRYSEK
jgi:hypothetical protein